MTRADGNCVLGDVQVWIREKQRSDAMLLSPVAERVRGNTVQLTRFQIKIPVLRITVERNGGEAKMLGGYTCSCLENKAPMSLSAYQAAPIHCLQGKIFFDPSAGLIFYQEKNCLGATRNPLSFPPSKDFRLAAKLVPPQPTHHSLPCPSQGNRSLISAESVVSALNKEGCQKHLRAF